MALVFWFSKYFIKKKQNLKKHRKNPGFYFSLRTIFSMLSAKSFTSQSTLIAQKKNLRHRTYHNHCRVFFFLGKGSSLYSNFTRITWCAIINFFCIPDIPPGIVRHSAGQCLIARQVLGYSGHEWPGKIAFSSGLKPGGAAIAAPPPPTPLILIGRPAWKSSYSQAI